MDEMGAGRREIMHCGKTLVPPGVTARKLAAEVKGVLVPETGFYPYHIPCILTNS
jgi:hypothetical protein